ncbi:MAG: insulinase family protein, partial [Elusimicrobiaceae bacterium]
KQLFGGWSGKAALPPTIAAPQTPQTRKVYYIERKVDNAPVVIYQDGPVRKDPDAYNFEVLNYIYGGSGLSSRLFSKVRTDLGLAYMVGSFTIKNNQKGAFETVTGTKNATVNAATTEILRQMKVISSEQVTDEELTRAQNGLVNSYVFEFTTPMEAVKERILRTYLGYPADFVEKYPDNIRAITKNSVLETAKKWLRPDNTMILVVGDESKLDKPLSALGEVIKRPAD